MVAGTLGRCVVPVAERPSCGVWIVEPNTNPVYAGELAGGRVVPRVVASEGDPIGRGVLTLCMSPNPTEPSPLGNDAGVGIVRRLEDDERVGNLGS